MNENQWIRYEQDLPQLEPEAKQVIGYKDIDYEEDSEWLEIDQEIFFSDILSQYTDLVEECSQNRKLVLEYPYEYLKEEKIHPKMFEFTKKQFSKFEVEVLKDWTYRMIIVKFLVYSKV